MVNAAVIPPAALPVTVASSTICAEYADGSITRGEVEVDAAQIKGRGIQRVWLEPAPVIQLSQHVPTLQE